MIRLNGNQDLQTKVMITMFGLFAEIERDLISLRTKEALAAAKASGKKLGRPKGTRGKSKLDGREEEIRTACGGRIHVGDDRRLRGATDTHEVRGH